MGLFGKVEYLGDRGEVRKHYRVLSCTLYFDYRRLLVIQEAWPRIKSSSSSSCSFKNKWKSNCPFPPFQLSPMARLILWNPCMHFASLCPLVNHNVYTLTKHVSFNYFEHQSTKTSNHVVPRTRAQREECTPRSYERTERSARRSYDKSR